MKPNSFRRLNLLSNKQKTLAASFNFKYIDDILSTNNRSFHDNLPTTYPLNWKSKRPLKLQHPFFISIYYFL